MTTNRKKQLSVVLGIVISIVIMGLLFRDIDFVRLGDALKGANYWWLLPNVALIIVSMYQRAHRWSFMMRPIKKVAFSRLVSATFIGFMANNVLPLRLGEFVRAYSLAYQDKEITKSASLATIFVERMIFDLVALLGILGGVVWWASINFSDELRGGVVIAVVFALAGLAFVLVLAKKPNQTGDFLARYLFFLPGSVRETVRTVVIKFSRGLEFVTQARTASYVAGHTLLIWLVLGVSNYFVFLAFGFDLPIDASYFLLVVVSVSILVPSSPGFVGVYHAGTVFALSQYGIGQEEAVSMALVMHAAQYIPITVIGFYHLRKQHLSLKQLQDDAVEDID
ncbi:MAG: flippase-like domain-containing protein [candidate division Zixibacteria bacterium]|nr:flippase-like domain-containing protein [candidate division Zixibacteria bacterium]